MSDGFSPSSFSFEKSASSSQGSFGDLNSAIESLGRTLNQPPDAKIDFSSGSLQFNSKEAYLAQKSLDEVKRRIEAEAANVQVSSVDLLLGKPSGAAFFEKETTSALSDISSEGESVLSKAQARIAQASIKVLEISTSVLELLGKTFIDLIPSGKELVIDGIFGIKEKEVSPEEKQAQAKKAGIIRSFFSQLSVGFQEMMGSKMSQIHNWLKSAGLEGADKVMVNTLRKLSNVLVEDIHRLGINEAGKAKSEQDNKKEERIKEAKAPEPVNAFLSHKMADELRGGGQHFSDAVG